MSNNLYNPPPAEQPRRRRSQRYAAEHSGRYRPQQAPGYPGEEERAPLPLSQDYPQPQRRERPQSYDYEADSRSEWAQGQQADYYDDDDQPLRWPVFVAILLLLFGIAAAV